MLKSSEMITQRLKFLETKETNWNKLKHKMHEDAAHASTKVKLDVDLRHLKTHSLRVEDSYFHAMLAPGRWKPGSDGAYFIDHDPEHFDRVLNYLRTGKLSLEGLSANQIQALREILDNLRLEIAAPVRVPVAWNPQVCDYQIRLSRGNRIVGSGESQKQGAISSAPSAIYSVHLCGRTADVLVGFAPQTRFSPNGFDSQKCGWYLDVAFGILNSNMVPMTSIT